MMQLDELFALFAQQPPDATCHKRIEQASENGAAIWLAAEVQRLQATLHRPALCIEIGTWCGFTALGMASAGALVICVDTFQGADSQMAGRGITIRDSGHSALERMLANTFALRAESRIAAVVGHSTEVAALFSDGIADLVFIDADHAEHAVAADLQCWAPKVRIGGTLCGHDAPQRPVMTAVEIYCVARGGRELADRIEADSNGATATNSIWCIRDWR